MRLAGIFASGLSLAIGLYSSDVVPLTPLSWFANPTNMGVMDVAGYNGGLLFMVRDYQFVEVIQVDLAGDVLNRTTIPPSDLVSASHAGVDKFAVDKSGSAFALQRGKAGSYLITIESNRFVTARQLLSGKPIAVTMIDDQPLLWDGTTVYGTSALKGSEGVPCKGLSIEEPTAHVAMGPHRFAIVNLVTSKIQSCDLSTNRVETVQLSAPELQGVTRDQFELAITAVSASSEGHLFGLISPLRPDRGAVVLEFDSSGQLVHRYLCLLPTLDTLKGRSNPTGTIIPIKIAVGNNFLYLVGSRHVARYQLVLTTG